MYATCGLWRTDALEPAFCVDAGSAIATGILVQALVDVMSTMSSSKATTLAYGATGPFLTHAPVLTGVGVAVCTVLTPLATQLERAVTPGMRHQNISPSDDVKTLFCCLIRR